MAVKTFNTRIKLKYDSSANWKPTTDGQNGLVLLQGEFGYDSTKKNFFIGDGTTASKSLKYVIGESIMADYVAAPNGVTLSDPIANTDSLNIALAKLQSQANTAQGVSNIDNHTGAFTTGNGISSASKVLDVITTGYLTVGNSGVDIDSSKIDSTYTTANTTDLATVATVTAALGTLDVPSTGTGAITGMGAGKTIATLTETDGKIAATFQDISITASQISDASTNLVTSVEGDGTYLTVGTNNTAKNGAVTVSHKTRTEDTATGTAQSIKVTDDNQSISIVTHTFDAAGHETGKTTTAVNFTKITAADLGLSSAMHFIGTSTTDPKGASGATVSGHTTWEKGDVVLYGNKEYVLSGDTNTAANWTELGDEGSYAQKTITLTAGNGLTGGGTLEANRTFAIDLDSTNANGLYLSGSTDGSKQLAMHIADESTASGANFGTVKVTNGNGLTISNGVVSYAHNTSAITVASKDNSTNIITINGTLTPDASDAITASNSISLAAVAATGAAADVSYTNTTSGLTATNVQAAIDEVAGTAAGAVQDVVTLKTSATGQSKIPTGESLEVSAGHTEVVLHDVAKTGNTDDLIQGMTILFDCGSATTVTDTLAQA